MQYSRLSWVPPTIYLGTFHERTQTANSNIKKSNRGIFENIPGYRKLWEVYERDPFGKKKKKKKGDKKKK